MYKVMKKIPLFKALLIVAGCCLTAMAVAEQKQQLGQWDVHYMVVSTTFLTPEVAKANDISRSRYNALVNISVLNSDNQKAQNLALMGSARNLLGTEKQLNFKQVVEGEAIYYLATLPYRDQETYRFSINIRQGNDQQTLKFQQKLYVD